MQQRDEELYSSPPMLRLLEDQLKVLKPGLQRCAGTHALLVGASHHGAPPALPLLGCWTSLVLRRHRYGGDLQGAADEPLPFLDEAFELVLVRHALEVAPHPSALLDEAIRVLAPGGALALTGIHPLSFWAPWLHWRRRGGSLALHMPWRLRHRLARAGMTIEQVQRIGSAWPEAGAMRRKPGNPFGGGYVLVARKRTRPAMLVRLRSEKIRVQTNGQLSPTARRGASH
ncbi:SAM-dependent methyltransferase [Rhodanobacter sp. TND4EL1]